MLDFMSTEFKRKLDGEWSSQDRLTSRSSAILTVIVTVLAAIVVASESSSGLHPYGPIYASSLVSIGWAALFALYSLMVRDFQFPPGWMMTEDIDYPLSDLRWSLVQDMADASKVNEAGLKDRALYINFSMTMFLVGTILFISSIFIG